MVNTSVPPPQIHPHGTMNIPQQQERYLMGHSLNESNRNFPTIYSMPSDISPVAASIIPTTHLLSTKTRRRSEEEPPEEIKDVWESFLKRKEVHFFKFKV